MNARKPKSADPAARPSSPSVTFTAFVVDHTITEVQTTQSGPDRSQPGRSKRVNESVSLTPVPRSSHVMRSTTSPKVR